MTSREMALGIIESAKKAGITLSADGDVLVVTYLEEPNGSGEQTQQHLVLTTLFRQHRIAIVDALNGEPA